MEPQMDIRRRASVNDIKLPPSVSFDDSSEHDEKTSLSTSLHYSPARSPTRKSTALLSRISMFENKNKPAHLPVKVGSPVVTRKKLQQRIGSPNKRPSRSDDAFKAEIIPSAPMLDDSPAPSWEKATSMDASQTIIYEAPLADVPTTTTTRKEQPSRSSSVQERLSMFEKRNRETLDSSAHTARVRRNSMSKFVGLQRQGSEGALSPRYSVKASPKGGRSSDLAPYASPGMYRVTVKSRTSLMPKAPLTDPDDDTFIKLESPSVTRKSYKVKGETSNEEDPNSLRRNTFHAYNRSDSSEAQSQPDVKRGWKPKSRTSKDVSSTSDHSTGTIESVISDDGHEFASDTVDGGISRPSWRNKREVSSGGTSQSGVDGDKEKRCIVEDEPELEDDEGDIPLKNDSDPTGPTRKKSWKPKRVISVEEMQMKSASDHTNSKEPESRSSAISLTPPAPPKRTWKPKQSTAEHLSPKLKREERSPKPNLDGSSLIRKSSKLADRISMFSAKASPEPEPTFLGSRYRNKLVQKQNKDELSSDPLGVTNTPKSPTVAARKKVDETPEIRSDKESQQDVAKEPTTGESLDKAAESESERKKMDKQKSANFDRRGKLKAKRSALVGQKNKDKNAVFASFVVRENDISSHKPPEFAKDPSEKKILLNALRKNFVFQEMEEKDMEKLVAAMEQFKVPKGEEIIRQGDPGDYFYVVGKGEVSFHVNARKVGSTGAGNAFGELALLYTCPRAATVIAESQPTTLFRVDHRTFRFMMQSETKKSEEEKRKLLENVPFLSSLGSEDVTRLCSVMKPVLFSTGDYIVKKGDKGSSFFIIQDGKVRVTEIFVGGTSYEDISLEKGDYFGEDALVSFEPRAANVVALTKGTAFSIDRENVRKVLGDFASLVSKAQDRQKLESMKILRDADLTSSDFDNLAKLITDKTFSEKTRIFSQDDMVEAALYIVREGSVKITTSDKKSSEVIGVGGAFGQDQLLADAGNESAGDCKIAAKYTATVVSDCVCGMLTLEDCRTIIDTAALGDKIFAGGNSALEEKRAALRALIQANVKYEDLDMDRIIGEGQFGTVWLVRADPHKTGDKSKMLEFAMKVQFKEDPVRKDGAIEAIQREMTVIHQLNHPFIIDLVDKYETEDQLMMLTEPVKGGELWSRIHREGDDGEWTSGMSEADAKFYALVVADTVAYMHRQKIIFRDLKPENVLIDEEGYPTLCDFGFAKYCPDKTFTFCGTPNYLAPEIVLNRGHGAAVDHWALGIVIYEMITGENPFYFEGQDQMALLQAIVQEDYYPLPDTVSKEVKDFMGAILEKDPVQRLGSLAGGEKGILKHEWFSELDINQVRNKKAKAPYIPDLSKK